MLRARADHDPQGPGAPQPTPPPAPALEQLAVHHRAGGEESLGLELLRWVSTWLLAGPIGPSGAAYEAILAKLTHKPAQLVIWGGATDIYGSYSFDKSCKNTVTSFRKVGFFTVQCIHSSGHRITPPQSMNKFIFEFFQDHPKNVKPEPYLKWPPKTPFTKGTYLAWPSYCKPAA